MKRTNPEKHVIDVSFGQVHRIDVVIRNEHGHEVPIARLNVDIETVRLKLLDDGFISIVANSTKDISLNLDI